jgi:oxygen-independent coproporphyrinogen-3 oxidase
MKSFPQHLYIHWPFCHSKCAFCDFVAFQGHEDFQEAYAHALCNEITTYAQHYAHEERVIKTIFLGGGTPSLCPLPLLKNIFDCVKNVCECQELQEVTIESNPTDIIDERLAFWRSCGINRLSIGVQCLDDEVLKTLNRKQRVADVERALRCAPQYFDNISVDLILGLPGVDWHSWEKTISTVVTWPIQHVSVYFLTIHDKTPLAFKIQQGKVNLETDTVMTDRYEWTVNELERHGFKQYEISNFARLGYESLHNQAYWNRRPYKGFGVGASSFDGLSRSTTTNNLMQYLQSDCNQVCIPPCSTEVISDQQAFLEILMLELRQKKGVDLQRMVYFLNDCQKPEFQDKITDLVKAGFIEERQGTIRLTLKGMALENEVILWLSSFHN